MPVKGVSCGCQHGDSKLGACDSECVGHPLHLTRPLLFRPPMVGLGEMWWSSTGLAYPHLLLQSQACCTGWLPRRPQLREEACSQLPHSAVAAAKKGKLPFHLAEEGLLGTVATGTGNRLAGWQQRQGGAARSYRSWLCLRHERERTCWGSRATPPCVAPLHAHGCVDWWLGLFLGTKQVSPLL